SSAARSSGSATRSTTARSASGWAGSGGSCWADRRRSGDGRVEQISGDRQVAAGASGTPQRGQTVAGTGALTGPGPGGTLAGPLIGALMRLPPTALAVGIALLLAGRGSSSPAGPATPPPPPPPPPPSGNTVRLTVVIPPRIDGRINTSMHRVLIISGSSGITSGGAAGAPLNRAGVTLKGFQCDRVANGPATCEVDI